MRSHEAGGPRPVDGTGAIPSRGREGADAHHLGRVVGAVDRRLADATGTDLRSYVLRRLFAVSDLLALGCALAATIAVKSLVGRSAAIDEVWLPILFVPLWVPIGIVSGLYHLDAAGRSLTLTTADEVGSVFRTATIWGWCLLLAWITVHSGYLELLPLVVLWALAIPVVLGFRVLTRYLARRRGWYVQNAVLVGHPVDRARLLTRIERHSEWGLKVVEQLDLRRTAHSAERAIGEKQTTDDQGGADDANGEGLLARGSLVDVATSRRADRVIFATPPGDPERRSGLVFELAQAGFQIDFVAGDSDVLSSSSRLSQLEGLPLLSVSPLPLPNSWRVIKRGLDLLVAVPTLLLTLPLLAYCAVRIKLDSPGPVFFGQERLGRDRRAFRLLKLRTMSEDADARKPDLGILNKHGSGLESGMFKAVDDPRVTKVGAWLRRYSLDELPQLWNVVKGDMSLVGPRPLPVAEGARIRARYELRYQVRPGMTGPWQVLGRSDIPFEDMLKLDYSYVLSWSLVQDLKLLVRTAGAVVKARGAY
jgi:exopolysaccharide biosynthesis polyprenyl glycosylphosphotransferase